MEIRIKTANKNFILPHKKNALMTQKDKLVELICEQYTKNFLSPSKSLVLNKNNNYFKSRNLADTISYGKIAMDAIINMI